MSTASIKKLVSIIVALDLILFVLTAFVLLSVQRITASAMVATSNPVDAAALANNGDLVQTPASATGPPPPANTETLIAAETLTSAPPMTTDMPADFTTT